MGRQPVGLVRHLHNYNLTLILLLLLFLSNPVKTVAINFLPWVGCGNSAFRTVPCLLLETIMCKLRLERQFFLQNVILTASFCDHNKASAWERYTDPDASFQRQSIIQSFVSSSQSPVSSTFQSCMNPVLSRPHITVTKVADHYTSCF